MILALWGSVVFGFALSVHTKAHYYYKTSDAPVKIIPTYPVLWSSESSDLFNVFQHPWKGVFWSFLCFIQWKRMCIWTKLWYYTRSNFVKSVFVRCTPCTFTFLADAASNYKRVFKGVFPACNHQVPRRWDPEDLVLDQGDIQQPHRPPRHCRTGLEGNLNSVSGECRVLVRNQARPRATTIDHGEVSRQSGTTRRYEWARTRG